MGKDIEEVPISKQSVQTVLFSQEGLARVTGGGAKPMFVTPVEG